jgi:hypothetical protein
METQDKLSLVQRTRLRNTSLWTNMDWGGLLTPLEDQQTAENLLAKAGVENAMAVCDETWDIKESQRDKTIQLEQFGINQDRQIADDKVATGRAKIAIQRAADNYTLAAMTYDAKVKGLIMGVREYAAQVELEQLVVEESRAVLAVAKEGLHLDQVNAQIYYVVINKAQVEADLARAQVDVAKANIRALMADIAAGEADIKVIQAEIEQYMAVADKATLQADVASIYAQIMTKQLSAVKFDVAQAEINSGFRYIASRLEDMLAVWDERTLIQNLKTELENALAQEVGLNLVAEKKQEDLRETEALNAQEVQDYAEIQTEANIEDETALRQAQVVAREALSDARMASETQRDAKRTWAEALINVAHRYVYLHSTHTSRETVTSEDNSIDMTHINEYIST